MSTVPVNLYMQYLMVQSVNTQLLTSVLPMHTIFSSQAIYVYIAPYLYIRYIQPQIMLPQFKCYSRRYCNQFHKYLGHLSILHNTSHCIYTQPTALKSAYLSNKLGTHIVNHHGYPCTHELKFIIMFGIKFTESIS